MRIQSARIVLSLFILSVSLVQLIELGHSLLHSIENPFHHHMVHKQISYKDHSLADHHFPKMKFSHEMDEPAPPSNFMAIAFGFFQPLLELKCSDQIDNPIHFTDVLECLYFFNIPPPTPPPLGVALS